MEASKKLKQAMVELEITQLELASRTEQTQANLSYKINSDNFRIYEYRELVEAMGCKLEFNIILPSGKKL